MGRDCVFGLVLLILSAVMGFGRVVHANTALGAGLVVTCGKIQFLASVDQSLHPVYEPSDYTIRVEPSVRGKYGYVAHTVAQNGATPIDDYDVQLSTVPFSSADTLVPVIHVMLPTLAYTSLSTVRISDIGVEANRQGGGGSRIYDLIGFDGGIVGRIVQLGFGYGLCGSNGAVLP